MSKEEKRQRLLEVRRQIYTRLYGMDIVPEEVESIIKEAFVELSKLYEEQGVSTDTIVSYIEGTFDETKVNIRTSSENDRRGVYWEQIENLFNKLEGKILNNEELSVSDTNGFEINDDNRGSTVINIGDMIDKSLENIQTRQRKLMEARGFSDEQIETQNNMVREFIMRFMAKKAEDIAEFYKNREKNLENEILEKVTDFINEMKSIEQAPEKSLKDNLRVDELTYEKQSANAKELGEKQKNGENDINRGLPDDLLK